MYSMFNLFNFPLNSFLQYSYLKKLFFGALPKALDISAVCVEDEYREDEAEEEDVVIRGRRRWDDW